MRKALTVPLSWLYGGVIAIRHMLYNQHLFLSHAVEVPTICVGNLAVGGTGKTPMVEYIVRLLLTNGFHPAVLSRGYKRKSRGFVMADNSSTVEKLGDEAMQVHHHFPDVPVAVCENRVRGVKQLQHQVKDLDVVVLDDAFQHRAIKCGLNILLTAYDRLYIDDHLLPWGNLRDLPHRALKADAIVVTKCPSDIRPIDMRVIDNRLHLPTYQQLHFAGIDYSPIEQAGTPLVLGGIAQPQYLFDYVKTIYPQAQLMSFPDHYAYLPKDIDAIIDRARHFDCVLTTEKDLERLRDTDLEERLAEQNKKLLVLPIQTCFYTPQENFNRQILTYVRENCRNHQ